MNLKEDKLQLFREEAIELVNQGYLAKAILHLEKGLVNQTELQANAAFKLVKQLALGGKFHSKKDYVNLINLIK